MALKFRHRMTYSTALFYLGSREEWAEEDRHLLLFMLEGVVDKLSMRGHELPVQFSDDVKLIAGKNPE